MSYTARTSVDGAGGALGTELALDPPLDVLCRFEGLSEPPPRRSLPAALRQVLAHECAVEAIRRAEAQRTARGAAAEAGEAAGNGAAERAPRPQAQRPATDMARVPGRCLQRVPRS